MTWPIDFEELFWGCGDGGACVCPGNSVISTDDEVLSSGSRPADKYDVGVFEMVPMRFDRQPAWYFASRFLCGPRSDWRAFVHRGDGWAQIQNVRVDLSGLPADRHKQAVDEILMIFRLGWFAAPRVADWFMLPNLPSFFLETAQYVRDAKWTLSFADIGVPGARGLARVSKDEIVFDVPMFTAEVLERGLWNFADPNSCTDLTARKVRLAQRHACVWAGVLLHEVGHIVFARYPLEVTELGDWYDGPDFRTGFPIPLLGAEGEQLYGSNGRPLRSGVDVYLPPSCAFPGGDAYGSWGTTNPRGTPTTHWLLTWYREFVAGWLQAGNAGAMRELIRRHARALGQPTYSGLSESRPPDQSQCRTFDFRNDSPFPPSV